VRLGLAGLVGVFGLRLVGFGFGLGLGVGVGGDGVGGGGQLEGGAGEQVGECVGAQLGQGAPVAVAAGGAGEPVEAVERGRGPVRGEVDAGEVGGAVVVGVQPHAAVGDG